MRSLFWKGMLAFLTVILVAVGTVALLVGRTTETEFRRYALVHGGTWNRQALELATYYVDHGSWDGVQEVLQALPDVGGSRGRGRGSGATGRSSLEFRLADLERQIVGDTRGVPSGTVSQAEVERGIPIEVEGRVVGYLLPSTQNLVALPLDPPQAEFLARIRTTLWIAALTALAAALVTGGLLFRSIIAPLRRLTSASQSIAEGDLSAHALVQGRDEVAQLADAFNRMTESLARAEKARQNQTADIAHELRTPLTVLRGSLEAMLDGVYPADREELLAASAQVRTLARLVDDLRLLALADAGQLRLHTAPLGLEAFLREIVQAHRLQAQERGVDLALETPSTLPLVLADRDRLAQVMGNLLGNALRYVPYGGHITVRAAEQGQAVVVAVADDGPGVSAEDLPHLFERFWRGDPGRWRATGGSGLGLAIARHIVEAHSGRIWAEPTAGSGITVAFTLPATSAA